MLHPKYRPGLTWVSTHNLFAMALSLAQEWASAATLFERLEDRVTEFPWQYGRGFHQSRKARTAAYQRRNYR